MANLLQAYSDVVARAQELGVTFSRSAHVSERLGARHDAALGVGRTAPAPGWQQGQ